MENTKLVIFLMSLLLLIFSLSGCANHERLSLEYPNLDHYQNNNQFSVTKIHGEVSFSKSIYQDKQNNYIIDVYIHGLYRQIIYKIAPDGEILDVLDLNNQLDLKRGYVKLNGSSHMGELYLVGDGIYSTWLTTGDATMHQVPLSKGVMNKTQFKQYYEKARAVFTQSDSYKAMAINAQGKWEYITLDFELKREASNEKFEISKSFTYSENVITSKNLGFEKYNQTADGLTLRGFKKEMYLRAPWLNVMGGPTPSNSWLGTGYFSFNLNGKEFKFSLDKRTKKYWSYYKFNGTIFNMGKFAIIDGYLVRDLTTENE